MKRIFAIIFAVALTPPAYGQEGNGTWVHEAFSPTINPRITVVLSDGAREGCWTNLKETREYSEAKLHEAGFEVVADASEATAAFEISVDSNRTNTGCYGTIRIQGWLPSMPVLPASGQSPINGSAFFDGSIFANAENANNMTLEHIRQAVEAVVANQ